MKFRRGFVSNSSTTSFAIFGIHEVIDEDARDELEEKANEFNITIQHDGVDYKHKFYIGISAEDLPRDKTLNDLEQELLKHLAILGFKETKCTWHVDGWYDG